jgi:hypothetical protein
MKNDGCGLCLKLLEHDGRALYVKVATVSDDIVVRDCPTPYVVATPDTETSWSWGHYFVTFNDAYEYLMKGEI